MLHQKSHLYEPGTASMLVAQFLVVVIYCSAEMINRFFDYSVSMALFDPLKHYSLTTCLVGRSQLHRGNGEQSSIFICKHTTLEDLEETDARQFCYLHPNKEFSIEIHVYRIIEHSAVKLTTSRIVNIATYFSTNLLYR